jgi:hypothetical protein
MIPPLYKNIGPVFGLPLRWQDEVSGVLVTAVKRYLNHCIDGTSIDEIDLELVRAYLQHYIDAPCWNHMKDIEEMAPELAGLRSDIRNLKTPDQIGRWIGRCMDLGMDPL